MDNIIKNKDYIIEIQGLGYEGEGVGKLDGFPIFVEGALPEEKALVKIVKVNKRYAFGKLMEVIKPSQNRVEPKCSIYKKCGGCQLQHLSYSEQLVYKKQRVKECLERIGQIKDVTIHDTLGMKTPYKYRNKVQLPVGKKDNEIRIGFYAQRSHDIINMDSCLIQDEAADKVVAITKAWMLKHNIQGYDETTPAIDDKTRIRHLMVRKGFKSGEIMVVLVTDKDKIAYINEFVEDIKANIEGVTSIIQNINPEATNVILGKKNITLWGNDCIVDYIDKYKFSISPLSFFQVNPIQTEVLYKKALEYAEITGEETVFDAYCGTGTISLFLAEKAKKVYGVEIIPEAIENAKNNAVQNNISNVEFLVGEAEKVIPELINQGVYADVVVVDPPRKGCEKSLLEAISLMKPKRIVYVSCDPGTLARDLAILQELGYITKEVQPVDMFPMTAHVETVVKMSRKDK